MKKLFVFFIFIFICFNLYSQDDYVSLEPIKDDKVYDTLTNPDYTNYTLNASAFTIKKKSSQVLGTDIFYLKCSHGFSDKTMGSVNLSLIGTFMLSVKHQFSISDDLNFAISGSGGNGLFLNKDSIIRVIGGQTVFTLGDKQNNLSFGAGLYFGKSTFEVFESTNNLYFHNVFFATQKQLKRRTYLVAEGMYFWNYNVFLGSVAIKIHIKRRMSLHLGLMPMYRNGRISPSQSQRQGGVAPIISYRWLFDD